MPALFVFGTPEGTSRETLRAVRPLLISKVEEQMGIKEKITRVFFVPDMAGDPAKDQDDTIWGFVGTGMFAGKPPEAAQGTTGGVALIIKNLFDGKIGVEVFPAHLAGDGKTLLHPD